MLSGLKRLLIGTPLATEQLAHERLTNVKALAVFSSDALSSVAYATEEVLLMLVLAGAGALSLGLPIGIAIAVLLAIVAISYRQTIFAYPSGGGSYIVAKENLGTVPGLTAGAALLIDYVLTVAVSTASGIAALTSAHPALLPYRVELCIAAIVLITVANLRGVRESGSIFAAPTYVFILSIFGLVAVGLYRVIFQGLPPIEHAEPVVAQQGLTLFLVLRAFSSGCSAMTGVEAISNGVQAFKEPVSRNAAKTLVWMAGILMSMFLGITFLAHQLNVVPVEGRTVLSELARSIVGNGWFFYLIQYSTMLILLLAANTSYADFPRLGSLIARDGFLPRQLAARGDRLVFSNGIVLLGILASLLIIHYNGQTHDMIPLYAVGVFLSFTLSQSGMVVHWFKDRAIDKKWWVHAIINGTGALVTAVVAVVIGATKFVHGAYIVILLIPVIILLFLAVKRHYNAVADSLRMDFDVDRLRPVKHTIIVPIGGVNRAVAHAVNYAMTLSDDVRVVYVASDPETTEKVKAKWNAFNPEMPLTVLPSPYRSIVGPLMSFINRVDQRSEDDMITVIVPEFVPRKWWHHLLHNQTAILLRTVLHFRPNTVVVSVPYHLSN